MFCDASGARKTRCLPVPPRSARRSAYRSARCESRRGNLGAGQQRPDVARQIGQVDGERLRRDSSRNSSSARRRSRGSTGRGISAARSTMQLRRARPDECRVEPRLPAPRSRRRSAPDRFRSPAPDGTRISPLAQQHEPGHALLGIDGRIPCLRPASARDLRPRSCRSRASNCFARLRARR